MGDINDERRLGKGRKAWNRWRDEHPGRDPNFRHSVLSGVDFRGMNLERADFEEAELYRARFGVDLRGTEWREKLPHPKSRQSYLDKLMDARYGTPAALEHADFSGADLSEAELGSVTLEKATLWRANLTGANLFRSSLHRADLSEAIFTKAYLQKAILTEVDLRDACFKEADLRGANLRGANLSRAKLAGAKLSGANLHGATLVETDFTGVDLTGCRIYGVSAWGLKLEGAIQRNLIITPENEPEITADDIEVGQFIYLLLHNEKISDVIDTIGKKGVLLLGRFTDGRMVVLERLREKLRDLGFVPMVFNFDKPETKDFTGTVRLLANLSKFVIVDITKPRAAPLELQATVPDYMVPFAPILQQGEEPFSMFVNLQNQYDWVLPVIGYPSVDRLIEVLEDKIVRRAEAKFKELLVRRDTPVRIENIPP